MTDYYQKKLLNAYWLHECNGYSYNQVAEHYGYGKAVNDHIRAMFNRFVKIGATSWDVADYLDGNYLRSVKALEYYLRFVGGQHRQISARTLAVKLGVYDVERLKCLLRGLGTTQPDLLSYTDTLDLDALTIR